MILSGSKRRGVNLILDKCPVFGTRKSLFFNTSIRQKSCLGSIKTSLNLTKYNTITSVQLMVYWMTFGDFLWRLVQRAVLNTVTTQQFVFTFPFNLLDNESLENIAAGRNINTAVNVRQSSREPFALGRAAGNSLLSRDCQDRTVTVRYHSRASY